MHALTIRFTIPETADWDAIRERFATRAALYADMPALKAKAFILSREHGHGGGNYVWDTKADADAFLASDFWATTVEKMTEMGFGVPVVQHDEVPAFVDGGEVVLPARV
ncbi:MAG: DUF4865 family protein [Acidimicrobiia bacterium]